MNHQRTKSALRMLGILTILALLAGGQMYWTNFGNTIYRANLDGTTSQNITPLPAA
jgi:hypothetical protein